MKSKKKNSLSTLNIQHNKYVMYILLVVAVVNLLMFLQSNHLGSILLFLIIGLASTFYTKNMNIILFSTIVITNLTIFIMAMFGYKEGYEGATGATGATGSKASGATGSKASGATGSKASGTMPSSMVGGNTPTGTTGATGPAPSSSNIQSLLNKTISSMNSNPEKFKNEDEDDDDDDDEPFKSIEEDIEDSKQIEKKKMDNSKISKDTEKQIKKLLQGADLKSLDTNELLVQQKGLMDAMKHMDPLIKNVNEMISNLKNSPISSFMGLSNN
jgi:hypothetical protein